MNLQKLFKTQAKLDEHIYEKHPELRGQNNLDWKILALQVELGECANEWRGFKKWSNDQEPRIYKERECDHCRGIGHAIVGEQEIVKCSKCDGFGRTEKYNPLLEEYVDCLHFILSIGLELGIEIYEEIKVSYHPEESITDNFMEVISFASELYWLHYNCASDKEKEDTYQTVFVHFLALGQSLGFTREQIEEAYYVKNQINHERQEAGY